MVELSEQIVSELKFIKWLLVILVVIGVYFSYLFFTALNKISDKNQALNKQLRQKNLEAELEEMLAKGNAQGAKFTALEWVASHPYEPWAHWYLAKAYDQLDDYINAKKTLVELKKLNPAWNTSIEPWLETIEDHLIPKGVK